MTKFSRPSGMTGINELDEDCYEFNEGFSYENPSPNNRPVKKNKTFKQNRNVPEKLFLPHNQLFELLEMEVARHQSHTLMNYAMFS